MTLEQALKLDIHDLRKISKDELTEALSVMRHAAAVRQSRLKHSPYRVASYAYTTYKSLPRGKLAGMSKGTLKHDFMVYQNWLTSSTSTIVGAKQSYVKAYETLGRAGVDLDSMTAEEYKSFLGGFWSLVDDLGLRSDIESSTSGIGSQLVLQMYAEMVNDVYGHYRRNKRRASGFVRQFDDDFFAWVKSEVERKRKQDDYLTVGVLSDEDDDIDNRPGDW